MADTDRAMAPLRDTTVRVVDFQGHQIDISFHCVRIIGKLHPPAARHLTRSDASEYDRLPILRHGRAWPEVPGSGTVPKSLQRNNVFVLDMDGKPIPRSNHVSGL